jgi:hypothetical protein
MENKIQETSKQDSKKLVKGPFKVNLYFRRSNSDFGFTTLNPMFFILRQANEIQTRII